MKISIITTTYNSEATIRNTLESVLGQTWKNIEYIIIDGASTDKTPTIVQSYAKDFGDRLVFKSEPDKGIYDAMNKGLLLATGDVVGVLNSDDFFTTPTILETVAKEFQSQSIDAVYGDVHYVTPNNLKRCVRYYSSKNFSLNRMRMGFMPAHPSFYCRRKVYADYGVFDISYKVAADFELLLRLLYVHKIKTHYIPLDFVTMRTGGISNAGWRSHYNIMRDHRRALKNNGVPSSYWRLSMRYFSKVMELLRGRLGLSRTND